MVCSAWNMSFASEPMNVDEQYDDEEEDEEQGDDGDEDDEVDELEEDEDDYTYGAEVSQPVT